jgi:diamine N-acetyltransferase
LFKAINILDSEVVMGINKYIIDENKIKFRDIDKSNYNECISLRVGEHQKNYVASNMYSLVQASYEDGLYPLGIFNEDEMIGFLLYDYDEELNGWSFSRFMIDIKYQNKGFGRKALEKFLEYFQSKFPNKSLYTSVEIDNDIAIKLYQKYGFVIKSSFEYAIEDVTYKEFRMIKEIW